MFNVGTKRVFGGMIPVLEVIDSSQPLTPLSPLKLSKVDELSDIVAPTVQEANELEDDVPPFGKLEW